MISLFRVLLILILAVAANILGPKDNAFAQALTVNGVAPHSALNLTTNFNAAIASIVVGWGAVSGGNHTYTLFVRSANGGLRHSTQTASKISYSLTFAGSGGQTVTMTTSDQTVGLGIIPNGQPAGSTTADSRIAFTGTSMSALYQGAYSDTLTFTLKKTGGTPATIVRTLNLTSTTVGSSLSFSITPAASANNLPLSASQTDLMVATATESSNSSTGYRVKVKSQNGGFLKHSLAGATPNANQKVSYSLKYGPTAATLTPANNDSVVRTQGAGLYQGVGGTVSISYTAPSTGAVISGNYSDILTFTIEAQ